MSGFKNVKLEWPTQWTVVPTVCPKRPSFFQSCSMQAKIYSLLRLPSLRLAQYDSGYVCVGDQYEVTFALAFSTHR